ncbi:hypothetical protein LSH36_56g06014 [Paralvinella palmiformis]|uniref:Uncharacterized protein n=1 Tax=Paralvinella palmiformis TaxID=53620 RepID=A0AAD9K5P0_9ANNE|nr:hypothetical protein LSH36_56g06014 [Paralvinella palmiformis]
MITGEPEQVNMSNHRRKSSVSSLGYGAVEDCRCCNASLNGSIKRGTRHLVNKMLVILKHFAGERYHINNSGKTRAVRQASNTGSLSEKAIAEEETETTETSEHESPERSTSIQPEDTLVPPVEPSADLVSDTESESDVDEDDEEVVVTGEGDIIVDKKEKVYIYIYIYI